jgi:hypothetical protein
MTKVVLAAVALVFLVAPIFAPLGGWAGELHFVVFVVQDMQDGSAAWLPTEVILHKEKDLTAGVVFVLDNPTARTHVFEAPGLFEQPAETHAETTTIPLQITVAPQETVHVQINVAQLERAHVAWLEEVRYRFFCPLHTADAELTGTVRIVP